MFIDMRALGACIVVGAIATASFAAAETNWGGLKTSDWGGSQSGAGESEQGAEVAQAASAGIEIKQAFVELGMAEERAACFEDVLAQHLSPAEQQDAAELVSQSATADDVKTNVMSAGPTMVGGFSAADASCPEGMGS